MLAYPTLDDLHALGLHGLAKGFKDLEHRPEARSLDHAEWLGLLLEYELTLRRQKQFETRTGRATAPCGQRRRRQLSKLTRPRPRPVPQTRGLRLDRRAAQSPHHRRLRTWQKLAGLRAWAKGLPGEHIGSVYTHAQTLR